MSEPDFTSCSSVVYHFHESRFARLRKTKSFHSRAFLLQSVPDSLPGSPRSPVDARIPIRLGPGPVPLSFFVDHPIDPPVIRTSIPRPFRGRTKFDERGPGDGPSKGDFRVFRRTTDNLFVARTRPERERKKEREREREREKSSKLRFTLLVRLPFPPSDILSFLQAVTYLTRPRDGSTLRVENAPLSSLSLSLSLSSSFLLVHSSFAPLLTRFISSTSFSSRSPCSVSAIEQEHRPLG